jgi:hypothetical protein
MLSRREGDSELVRQQNIRILDPKLLDQVVRDRKKMRMRSLRRRARQW